MPSRGHSIAKLARLHGQYYKPETFPCTLGRRCGRPAVYWVSWEQRNMGGHGMATFSRHACEEHAAAWAKKNGLDLESPR